MAEMRIETITPQKASEYLTKNTSNRPLMAHLVTKLAKAITEGEWRLNGETIKFNGECLVDGQHRLNAIIRAGVPVKTYVVRGLEADVFETIDTGKSRSIGDVLAKNGEKNYTTLASALRWLSAIRAGKSKGGVSQTTNSSFLKFLEDNAELRDRVSEVVTALRGRGALFEGGMLAAFYSEMFKLSESEAKDFLEKISTGENLTKGMPELALRTFLIDRKMEAKKHSRDSVSSAIVSAWNAKREKRNLSRILIRSGPRPEIV